jgi:hypothetical protein
MRPRVFSDASFERIKAMVQENKSAEEIADAIGCTVSSLKVKCSQHRISLRRPGHRRAYKHPSMTNFAHAKLRQKSKEMGITKTALMYALLEVIVRDNLYDAVLDVDRDMDRAA